MKDEPWALVDLNSVDLEYPSVCREFLNTMEKQGLTPAANIIREYTKTRPRYQQQRQTHVSSVIVAH
jgi:hypothetical protein